LFSQRSRCFGEENAISLKKRALLASGRTLLDLTRSNPTETGLAPFEQLRELLAPPETERYAPDPFGIISARQALSERWSRQGHSVAPEQILLTASTSEAYGFLFKLFCDPGDELLVPEPSYPLFEHLARLEHAKLLPYRLLYDGAWHIDLDSLRSAITPKSRAILLVNPNNPTGSIVSQSELVAIAEMGLPLISDEVFSGFLFGAATARFRSAITVQQQLVFALDGLSKSMGLPQCKLGFTTVGGPKQLVAEAMQRLEVIGDSYLSVGTAVQLALPELLKHEPERHQVIQSRLEQNLACLKRVTSGSSVTTLAMDGGFSAVLRVPRTRSESEWVLGLLEEPGVLVQPGWFYDFASEAFLVVSLLTLPHEFEQGIERLCHYVDTDR